MDQRMTGCDDDDEMWGSVRSLYEYFGSEIAGTYTKSASGSEHFAPIPLGETLESRMYQYQVPYLVAGSGKSKQGYIMTVEGRTCCCCTSSLILYRYEGCQ
jgi:hypothetical protein